MARTTYVCLAVAIFASVASGKKLCPDALTALSGSDFTTLAAAVTAAFGPLDEFDGMPDNAVAVAPNNEAFDAALAKLGSTAEQLLENKELLTKVLYDHVAQVAEDGSITTLNGNAIEIMVDGKEVSLKEAMTAKTVTIDVADGISPVTATTPISCFDGSQLIFPSNAVILTEDLQ